MTGVRNTNPNGIYIVLSYFVLIEKLVLSVASTL